MAPVLKNNHTAIQQFQQRLLSESNRVLVYEDQNLQQKAKSVVPIENLRRLARQACTSTCELELKDALLVELINWFKHDFFSWFDAGRCSLCDQNMIHNGMGNPTQEEIRFNAQRIELYSCPSCGTTDRFPRYNDPGINFFLNYLL